MTTAKRKTPRKPARRPRRAVVDLDDLQVPGNDEFPGPVAVTLGGGVAGFAPAAFDRLSRDERDLAGQLMRLVGQRRQLGRDIDELVGHMRGHGLSWGVIGWCVGTSSEAARQRWTARDAGRLDRSGA